ncbi:hypothetical protein B0T25DRAFT_629852 [Lasiosphaeria hispida]|uniref:Uncharacterized protein n=1 Tax=Lasiosphaeria hispida TaxID=260671 RepID=A0AAJ0MFA5_9PEZI|nr:hypothetical protein B0T25DRAFT_629852 [Lasiosphaeria hispida]
MSAIRASARVGAAFDAANAGIGLAEFVGIALGVVIAILLAIAVCYVPRKSEDGKLEDEEQMPAVRRDRQSLFHENMGIGNRDAGNHTPPDLEVPPTESDTKSKTTQESREMEEKGDQETQALLLKPPQPTATYFNRP